MLLLNHRAPLPSTDPSHGSLAMVPSSITKFQYAITMLLFLITLVLGQSEQSSVHPQHPTVPTQCLAVPSQYHNLPSQCSITQLTQHNGSMLSHHSVPFFIKTLPLSHYNSSCPTDLAPCLFTKPHCQTTILDCFLLCWPHHNDHCPTTMLNCSITVMSVSSQHCIIASKCSTVISQYFSIP